MNTLETKLSGNGRTLTLKNPILTASGTFGYGLEFTPFGELKELGGIIVKGLSLKPREGNAMPRLADAPSGLLNSIGLQNCGLDVFLQEKLPKLRELEAPVIVNLYATGAEEFADLAERLVDVEGIIGVEVNISCPNVKEGGIAFGKKPRMAAKVTEAVVKVTKNMPVIVKLSPNVTDIAAIAKACEESGATALSCINTLSGMSVDLEKRTTRLSVGAGGLSGPAIKAVALRCVWEVSSAVTIPVIGLGGITSAEDALEFMLVGAQAVQIGTANFINPDSSFRVVKDLPKVMNRLGIENLNAFKGSISLPR